MLMIDAPMREISLLLALDEPAAALGAVTEYELLKHYTAPTRHAARPTSAITALLSHASRCSDGKLAAYFCRFRPKPLPHLKSLTIVRGASK